MKLTIAAVIAVSVLGCTKYSAFVHSPFANGGSGHIQGVELTFQTPFFFLPGPLSKFGVYSNFAYVDSNLKEFSPANNPLRMTGLAKNTATVDLWYSNAGFEARLGWKYH